MTDNEFNEKQTELLNQVPEEFRGPLSYMAYEHGHSAGHDEVLGILQGLVSDLHDPIVKFENRIRAENKQ